MNTVTIIGAGPAGLQTAIELKERGWDSRILEEHSQVGVPTHCSGLISSSGARELELKLKACTENEIFGAKLVSPKGSILTVKRKKPVAYVIDRAAFDKSLQKQASRLGLKITFNSKLIDIHGSTVFFKKKHRGEMEKTKILVGADGVQSKTRELLGVPVQQENFVHTYQEFVSGTFDPKLVQMHFGSFAQGFFAWVIPESAKKARVGIGTSLGENAAEAFKKFTSEKKLEFTTLKRESFLIPVGPPLKNFVFGSNLLVGDAAFHAKATTGGGLVMGLSAAKKCAASIDHFLKNGKPLNSYNSYLKDVTKELKMHWKMRSFLNSQSDEKIDRLFGKLKKAGIEEFLEEHGDMDKPSRFVGKVLKKPGMWKLAGLAVKFR